MGGEPVLSVESGRGVDPGVVAARTVGLAGPTGRVDWRGDVALELWVESDTPPARVRLAGRLDATTAANLTQVVRELLADGSRAFELCTEGLRVVDASALGALADIERLVRDHGGTLVRVGPANGPFARTRLAGTPHVGQA
jgi:anti-anti-sigma factor